MGLFWSTRSHAPIGLGSRVAAPGRVSIDLHGLTRHQVLDDPSFGLGCLVRVRAVAADLAAAIGVTLTELDLIAPGFQRLDQGIEITVLFQESLTIALITEAGDLVSDAQFDQSGFGESSPGMPRISEHLQGYGFHTWLLFVYCITIL
mgnify:CR=1 FL=1